MVICISAGFSYSVLMWPRFAVQSPLQLCLEISISSNSRNLLQFPQFVTVHCKGERRKPDSKPYPLPYSSIRNPYRNPKSEKYQDYAQKPQRNCTFMNSPIILLLNPRPYRVLHQFFWRINCQYRELSRNTHHSLFPGGYKDMSSIFADQ